MAKDERLYAKPVLETDFPYYGERQWPWLVYLVSWPVGNHWIVKAGQSESPRRWRTFTNRGASIEALWQTNESTQLETYLHARLASIGVAAFASKPESRPYLGNTGDGYTECYRLDPWAYTDLPDLVKEVADGLVQSR